MPKFGESGEGILPRDLGISSHPVLQINPMAATQGLGGVLGGGKLPVRAAKENLSDLTDANFSYGGRILGNRTVPIESLTGGISKNVTDRSRVDNLADQIKGPSGYIERLIVDDSGNVIEGQHRLEAMRQLGITKVPVTMIKDLAGDWNTDAMQAAIKATGTYHPDQVNQLTRRALESIDSEGTPQAAAANTSIGGIWEAPYQAALSAASQKTLSSPDGQ